MNNSISISESSWREFERIGELNLTNIFNSKAYKLVFQRPVIRGTGVYRVDAVISERKRGGRRAVVDFKHFQTASIYANEVESIAQYKRMIRASSAVMAVSECSIVTERARKRALELNVVIVKVPTSLWGRVTTFLNGSGISRKRIFN